MAVEIRVGLDAATRGQGPAEIMGGIGLPLIDALTAPTPTTGDSNAV